MRSFFAFLACAGFITWAHSCDKKIFGVQAGLTDQEPSPVNYTPTANTVLAAAFTPIKIYGHIIIPMDPVHVQELVPTVNLTMSPPIESKQAILRRKLATIVPLKVNMKKKARRITNDSLLILPYLHASLSSAHLLQY